MRSVVDGDAQLLMPMRTVVDADAHCCLRRCALLFTAMRSNPTVYEVNFAIWNLISYVPSFIFFIFSFIHLFIFSFIQTPKIQRVEVHQADSKISVVKMEKGAAAASSGAAGAATTSLELPQMSCFTCKFIMGEGKRILTEESTIDQLTKLSETICNDLKGDLKVG